jgi:hypothetical protein
MERPRHIRRLRKARSVPNTSSLPSPHPALIADVPQVLERSMRRLQDVKQRADVTMGPGILVKLFAVPPEGAQSVDGSQPTLWFVGSPNATRWSPRKSANAHEANAKTTGKATVSITAKASSASKHRMRAKPVRGKAVGQKEQRSLAKGERNVVEQPAREGQIESDDMSDEQEREEEEEQEDDAGEDDVGEDDVGEDDAGEDDVGEDDVGEDDAGEDVEEDFNDSRGDEDLMEEEEVGVNDGNEHGTKEQDDNGHNDSSEVAEAEEAEKRADDEHEGEEDLEEDIGDQEEQETEGQKDAGVGLEAGVEGEREGGEKSDDEAELHNDTRGKDGAIRDDQEDEHRDDGGVGKEQGDHGNMLEGTETVEQRVTASHRNGAWRSWDVRNVNSREEGEKCTTSGGEERMVEDENKSAEETRKRAFACSTPNNPPNKRSKTDDGENEDDAATKDSLSRTNGLETQTRPRTPSLESTTPSSPKTIEIVRQVSVVPGLEGTESGVWDAARRDAVFTSLSGADQKKMVCTAVSLASEKGIKELQRFVCDTRKNVKQNGKSLESEFDLSAYQSDADTRNADGTLIPRDSGLARLTALYQQITTLDNAAIKLSVTRRVKLAAMAQYRKSLLPEGAGRKQAKAANLRLFRAIHPEHATIERPDEATKSVALDDWQRLRDRLREGRRWLDIRDRFGGVGAFLALPSQCVSDRYVQKMQAEKFGSWLLLLDVAWRALDAHARLTLNMLVRMSLAGQPLPEAFLALESLKAGDGTALDSLSGMLTGWPSSNRICGDACAKSIATPTQPDEDSGVAAHEDHASTTSTTSRVEEAGYLGRVRQMEMVRSVEDGLLDGLDDLDFDESLSQE